MLFRSSGRYRICTLLLPVSIFGNAGGGGGGGGGKGVIAEVAERHELNGTGVFSIAFGRSASEWLWFGTSWTDLFSVSLLLIVGSPKLQLRLKTRS